MEPNIAAIQIYHKSNMATTRGHLGQMFEYLLGIQEYSLDGIYNICFIHVLNRSPAARWQSVHD